MIGNLLLHTEFNIFKMNFVEATSPLMYGIIELHDHIFFFFNLILFIVLFLLVTTIAYCTYFKNSKINKFLIVQSVTQKYD